MRTIIIKLAPFFLFGGAAIASLFIIGKDAPASSANSKSGLAQALEAPSELISASDGSISDSAGSSEGSLRNNTASGNLTDLFAQRIAEEILTKNPSGPTIKDGKTGIALGNPEDLIEQLLRAEETRSVAQEFRGVVAPSEIRVSSVNSTQAIDRYFTDVQQILLANESGLSPKSGIDEFQQILVFKSAVQKIIKGLLAVEVPASLASWHREMLILARTEENALGALARADEDPLKAFVALQSLRESHKAFSVINQQLNASPSEQN